MITWKMNLTKNPFPVHVVSTQIFFNHVECSIDTIHAFMQRIETVETALLMEFAPKTIILINPMKKMEFEQYINNNMLCS